MLEVNYMATNPASILQLAINTPEATGLGLLAGFVLAKALAWRKKRQNGMNW